MAKCNQLTPLPFKGLMLCGVFVCSRAAEEAEASSGDVTEELDELRKSFSARLRSETLQRLSENLEKDSKIQRLETIVESQLKREKAKDRKIAELEEKVEAMVQIKEATSQGQAVTLKNEQETLLSTDGKDTESETGTGRNGEMESQARIRDDSVQAANSKSVEREPNDQLSSTNVQGETQHCEKLQGDNKETRIHGEQKLSARKVGCRGKLSFLPKRKTSKTKVTR